MAEILPNLVKAIEFGRISPNDLFRAVSSQEVMLSPVGYHLVKVLFQEKHRAPFKVFKDFFAFHKSTLF